MKKLLTLFLSFLLLLPPFSVANADDIYDYIWVRYQDKWDVAFVNFNSETSRGDSWHHYYTGHPATDSGESDSGNYNISYGVEVSGTPSAPIKALELAFGFSLSAEESFGITHNSRPLEKGEYVRAYWRKYYRKHTAFQVGSRSGYAYNIGTDGLPTGSPMEIIDCPMGTRPYEACYPLMPQIKLEYYSNSYVETQSSQGIRTEIYTFIDGKYILTDDYYQTSNPSS